MLAYYKNKKFATKSLRPYKSLDGRYTCKFQGSLCNEQDLRQRLEKTGITFTSSCTEELIIELYRYCDDSFVKELRGKFAIIIFDHQQQQLILARDRYGICLLYYQLIAGGINIGTKPSVFNTSTKYPLEELNQDSLRHYFSYGYIPEEDTYLKNVYHVPAGCLLKYDDVNELTINPFADMLVIEGSRQSLVDGQLLRDVITEGIYARMLVGKGLGVFYTGKVDELVLVSIVKQVGARVKVFSAEFGNEFVSDESFDGRVIRRRVCADDYWQAAIDATYAIGVPLADRRVPIDYLLAELASKYVDVILSTDGANMLFGTDRNLRKKWDGLIFTEDEKEKMLKFEGKPWQEIVDPYLIQLSDLNTLSKWQTLELNTRLKGSQVLSKEKLAACHGLETSFPFLDDQILNVASFLTKDEKQSMRLFRQVFADQISKLQLPREKAVYQIPLAKWIRTDLYEKIKELFEEDVVQQFFDTELLLIMLEKHRKGFRDLSDRIWVIAMFVVWLKKVVKP